MSPADFAVASAAARGSFDPEGLADILSGDMEVAVVVTLLRAFCRLTGTSTISQMI